jgi:hypothetical protein
MEARPLLAIVARDVVDQVVILLPVVSLSNSAQERDVALDVRLRVLQLDLLRQALDFGAVCLIYGYFDVALKPPLRLSLKIYVELLVLIDLVDFRVLLQTLDQCIALREQLIGLVSILRDVLLEEQEVFDQGSLLQIYIDSVVLFVVGVAAFDLRATG